MKKNIKKFSLGLATVSALSLGLFGCGNDSESASDSNTEKNSEIAVVDTASDKPLKFWTTSNAIKSRIEEYTKENGEEVDTIVIPYADFQVKLKQSISDPATTPDVFVVSRDFVRDWVETPGAILNLSEVFPDDTDAYVKNTYSNFVDLGSQDGSLYSVTGEFPVGMMLYNRTASKEILGTEDPEQVGGLLDSKEKLIAVNEKLKETYDGSVKLFGTFQNMSTMLFTSRTEPWVTDNIFKVDKFTDEFMDWAKVVYDNDMILTEMEDDAYFSGYQTGKFMLDYLPTWGYRVKAKPQIEKINEAGWGITSPMVPYIRGGSYFMISSASQNQTKAWEIIKHLSIDEDEMVKYNKETLDLSSNKDVNEELVNYDYKEPLLGGQEIFKTYAAEINIVDETFGDTSVVTKYDGAVIEYLRGAAVSYATGKSSKENALKDFKQQLESAYPEITVELNY